MKEKKSCLIVIGVTILCIVFLINLFKKDIWDSNEQLLRKEILSIEESVDKVNLLELTPFEWDTIYSFAPYTSKEVVYEAVGYKWDRISETVSEGMDQIVFLKDGKVICYIYGYYYKNGYSLYLNSKHSKSGVSMIDLQDNLNFRITRSDKVVYLKRIK